MDNKDTRVQEAWRELIECYEAESYYEASMNSDDYERLLNVRREGKELIQELKELGEDMSGRDKDFE